jgi:hypothetical protein
MSEKGQTRKSGDAIATSALPRKADSSRISMEVRLVPNPEVKIFCDPPH